MILMEMLHTHTNKKVQSKLVEKKAREKLDGNVFITSVN